MKPVDVIAAFDRLASRNDAWYATPLGAFADAREKEAVFALAEVQPGEPALDVGRGTGNYTLALARPGALAVGADPAPAMLAVASSKAKEAGLPVRFAIGPPILALERVGRRWLRPCGAFLVARVRCSYRVAEAVP